MTEMLTDLYQEVILDHKKRPRNFRIIEDSTGDAEGFNPLCGDRVHIYLTLKDGMIEDISFQGDGCAISTASASLLTEGLKGRTESEAQALFDDFHHLVTGEYDQIQDRSGLGKLEVFSGVSAFPARVKCAVLVWHTLKSALADHSEVVSTE